MPAEASSPTQSIYAQPRGRPLPKAARKHQHLSRLGKVCRFIPHSLQWLRLNPAPVDWSDPSLRKSAPRTPKKGCSLLIELHRQAGGARSPELCSSAAGVSLHGGIYQTRHCIRFTLSVRDAMRQTVCYEIPPSLSKAAATPHQATIRNSAQDCLGAFLNCESSLLASSVSASVLLAIEVCRSFHKAGQVTSVPAGTKITPDYLDRALSRR